MLIYVIIEAASLLTWQRPEDRHSDALPSDALEREVWIILPVWFLCVGLSEKVRVREMVSWREPMRVWADSNFIVVTPVTTLRMQQSKSQHTTKHTTTRRSSRDARASHLFLITRCCRQLRKVILCPY